MTKKAFTIIELLVVIGIISLLTAIMMPSMSRARKHADNLKCKSNLRQFGLILEQYTQQNNDYFPNPDKWLYSKNVTDQCQWHDQKNFPTNTPELKGSMWDYFGDNEEIFLCPTFRKLAKTRGTEHEYHYLHEDIPIEPQFSYPVNRYLGKNNTKKTNSVRHPSNTFSFSEQNMFSSNIVSLNTIGDSSFTINQDIIIIGEVTSDNFASYHNVPNDNIDMGFANAVFLDGHVQLVSPRDNPYRYAWPK